MIADYNNSTHFLPNRLKRLLEKSTHLPNDQKQISPVNFGSKINRNNLHYLSIISDPIGLLADPLKGAWVTYQKNLLNTLSLRDLLNNPLIIHNNKIIIFIQFSSRLPAR